MIQSLKQISPDLGKYIVEFAFGEIYAREGLSLQERERITPPDSFYFFLPEQ